MPYSLRNTFCKTLIEKINTVCFQGVFTEEILSKVKKHSVVYTINSLKDIFRAENEFHPASFINIIIIKIAHAFT